MNHGTHRSAAMIRSETDQAAGMQEMVDAVRDPARLQSLRATGLLDSQVEEEFDRLTRLAAKLLGAPATFFSLVDEDRDFYKSCVGFSEPLASERELHGVTFCHYSLLSDGALVIPDTRADPIYRTVPTVETLGVAAYLGVPVRSPTGDVLGSFCAIDFEPRDWAPLNIETMKELAKSAEREVAIRHWMRSQTDVVEREREALQALERVVESRGRLIRGFSHDVKNPLGAADGFLALLEDGIIGEVSGQQLETVVRVRRSIAAALDLINELVEIARAEAGELEVRAEPVDLRELARDLADEYRAQAEGKGLKLRCKPAAADFPMILSDAPRIRQMLSNLLSNAVKYTPEGQVTVSLRIAGGEGPQDGASRKAGRAIPGADGWAAIDVVDTGPGVPEEQRHLLFREFSRLDPEAAPGAGLGLAISARIAQALGGSITMSGAPGGGSTFTLRLPAVPAAAARASPE